MNQLMGTKVLLFIENHEYWGRLFAIYGKNGKTAPLKTDEGDPWKTVQTVPRKTEEIDHLKTLQIAPPRRSLKSCLFAGLKKI